MPWRLGPFQCRATKDVGHCRSVTYQTLLASYAPNIQAWGSKGLSQVRSNSREFTVLLYMFVQLWYGNTFTCAVLRKKEIAYRQRGELSQSHTEQNSAFTGSRGRERQQRSSAQTVAGILRRPFYLADPLDRLS